MSSARSEPASFLREAADRLEELAEKATPGPWFVATDAPWHVRTVREAAITPMDEHVGEPVADTALEPDADLIATFGNPRVARAVAEGMRDESHTLLTGRVSEPTTHSLAVAAAVLGRPVESGE